MQEYNIIIEIDENGNVKAETKGMKGNICVSELDAILKDIEGEKAFKNKPEYYQQSVSKNKNVIKIKNDIQPREQL